MVIDGCRCASYAGELTCHIRESVRREAPDCFAKQSLENMNAIQAHVSEYGNGTRRVPARFDVDTS